MSEIYADVRRTPGASLEIAWQDWRAARNDLLKNHPQSPLDFDQRSVFRGLPYYAYDLDWRVTGIFEDEGIGGSHEIELGADDRIRLTRVGIVRFSLKQIEASLSAFWIEGYGGGLFIPFRDSTNGVSTFGGGRYLYDTIKGADLGTNGAELNLDFNFSYNPSCAYNSRWVCPLAPAENTLALAVTTGEKYLAF
ncbi:MAG: DUF1684 domain-containing protein [Candidatus Promineifilaceae bacterium]